MIVISKKDIEVRNGKYFINGLPVEEGSLILIHQNVSRYDAILWRRKDGKIGYRLSVFDMNEVKEQIPKVKRYGVLSSIARIPVPLFLFDNAWGNVYIVETVNGIVWLEVWNGAVMVDGVLYLTRSLV